MTGQKVMMNTMPLRWGHYRVLIIASMGQIMGAGLATLVGVIIPMIQLFRHPELSPLVQGLIGCASLIGITIGSLLFGRLSDKYGYLFFFRFCPLLILSASLLAYYQPALPGLVTGLFVMGLGIGGGYSLDSDYISEIMPERWRLFMVGVAKASSSLGNIGVALLCFFLLRNVQEPEMWNRLLLIIAVFAAFMLLFRIRFAQSPGWLLTHNRPAEAEVAAQFFLGQDVEVKIGSDMEVGEIRNRRKKKDAPQTESVDLFKGKNLKRVIFSGIPWACEGLGVYGIGVFLPILVMALGLEPSVGEVATAAGGSVASSAGGSVVSSAASSAASSAGGGLQSIISSIKITAWINFFILPGFALGLFLVNRWYHVRIQVWGFILCSVGLTLLLVAYKFHLSIWLAIAGFMMFELFLNAGPHLMTFIIPSQIYPVADRGEGAGIAAAMGKVGAVLGVLFIPMLLTWGGAELVLLVTIIVQIIGALITGILGREVLPHPDRKQKIV